MFQGMGVVLPLPTRMLIAFGQGVQRIGLFLLVGMALAAGALIVYLRSDQGRRAKDRTLLKVPIIGDLLLQIELARFARTLSTLISGGVPAMQAVQICARVSGNSRLAQAFAQTAESIRTGSRVAAALEKTEVIPAMTVQMISVGETTGSLDLILGNIADLYDLEVENRLQTATTLIEPAVILGVGLIVAVIIASVLLPMFNMIGQLG
jgi:type IV pilus assembly protein PilC